MDARAVPRSGGAGTRALRFDGFEPSAMAGGSEAQAEIQANLIAAVRSRMTRRPCRARDPRRSVVSDPIIVFEILGDGTAGGELIDENAEYRAIPATERYVILQQTHTAAIVFSRKGRDWVTEIVASDDAMLRLPEVAVEFPLAELYRDVELAPRAAAGG